MAHVYETNNKLEMCVEVNDMLTAGKKDELLTKIYVNPNTDSSRSSFSLECKRWS